MTNLFIYIFAISKQAGSVQLTAGLNGGLYNQSKGLKTTSLGAMFPTLCKNWVSCLTSPAN